RSRSPGAGVAQDARKTGSARSAPGRDRKAAAAEQNRIIAGRAAPALRPDRVSCEAPMSLAVVHSRALAGLEATPVAVEVHLAGGLPAFNLVGLPDTEVKESRERGRAALENAQFEFPARKITVNLAPADLPKESGRFDLPIAIGILAATKQIPDGALAGYEFAGELALGGALRPIRGALPMALCARRDGRAFVLPAESAAEAALVRGAVVYPASAWLAVCAPWADGEAWRPLAAEPAASLGKTTAVDLADVRGQDPAKRALTI